MFQFPSRSFTTVVLLLVLLSGSNAARGGVEEESGDAAGLSLAAARSISFETSEGTWMSLDVSPDGSRLVFELLGDLYLLPIEGGSASALTTGMSFDSQPRFSPDGERVVFVSDRGGSSDVWTVSLDGEEILPLTDAPGTIEFTSPEYSPDGTHVVVSRTSWSQGVHELWAYHVDGGKGVQITQANPAGDTATAQRPNSLGAVYSPDGHYLYFSRKFGGFAYNVRFPLWQIVRRDLTTGEEDYLTQAEGSAFRPRLSPDGTLLVYGTRYEQQTGLRVRDLRTGEDRWLAYPVEHDDQESRFTRDLLPGYAFTPDGSAIILSVDGRLRRLNVADGSMVDIPFTAEVNQALGPRLYYPYRLGLGPVKARMLMGAELSPDGRKLAFSSFLQLHVYDLATGDVRTLTADAGPASEIPGAFHPAWSPDSRELAFVSWSSGGGHIWRVRANGRGKPTRVTERTGYYSDPVWTPDAEQILALRAASYDRLYVENEYGPTIGSDLIRVDRDGGEADLVLPARGFQRPHFGPDGDRVFLYQGYSGGLSSVRLDGSDRRDHLEVKAAGIMLTDEEVAPADVQLSPDGAHALILHANQLHLVRLLNPHLTGLELSLANPNLPVTRVTDVGADFFGFAEGGRSIFWTVGNSLYQRPLASLEFKKLEDDSLSEDAEQTAETALDEEDDFEIAESQDSVEVYSVDVYRPRHEPEGVLVLSGATVLTMQPDEPAIRNAAIVIVNNRIEQVGPAAEVSIPVEAEVLDVSGQFILPGFVDTHAHYRLLRGILEHENWGMLANLAYGVTTGLDVQPSTTDILAYEDLVDAGLVTGPRTLSTGPGIFSNNEFRSVAHAEAVLRRYKEHYGVRNLKAYLSGNRAQRQYLVQAAKNLRLMPTTEGALDMKLNLTHVIDGFSGNEHTFPLLDLHADTVQLVARSGIAYTPTLLVAYGGPFAENYFYTRESPHRDPKLRRFMPEHIIARRTLRTQWFLEEEYSFPALAAQAAKIIRAGGRVGVGAHGQLQGLGYHWEMWSLAAGGLTPLEVLTAATRHGAEMIGVAADVGTVAEGKLADLVILDADPLADIRNTARLRFVVKNGELYEAESLDKLWPEKRPLPDMWWWHTGPANGHSPAVE